MKYFNKLRIFLVLSVLLAMSFGFANAEPLRIAVYVDSDLSRSFPNDLAMKIELAEIFRLASSHFEREIGRPLDFSVREYVKIPDFLLTWFDHFKGDAANLWFRTAKLLDGDAYKFLLTPRRLKYEDGLKNGSADPPARLALTKYSPSRQISVTTLLHEIGHLCGLSKDTDHSSDPKSHMFAKAVAGSTYGEFIPRIKEACGEKKATEDFAALIK